MNDALITITAWASQVPDTTYYLGLGLGVVFGGMLVYIGSLVLRFYQVQKEKQRIMDLLEENKLQREQE